MSEREENRCCMTIKFMIKKRIFPIVNFMIATFPPADFCKDTKNCITYEVTTYGEISLNQKLNLHRFYFIIRNKL